MTVTYQGGNTEASVRALARFLSDLRPFWPLLTRAWIGWVTKQFVSEGGFAGEGGGWAPLSPGYAEWKARHYPGRTILIRDGDMRRAATTPQRVAGPDFLELIVHDPKLGYHQEGTANMPARPVVFGWPLPPPMDAEMHQVATAYVDDLIVRLGLT